MYKDLIIFEKMYELNLWLFPMVNTFPKAQRFVLGQQIQTLALRITMGIMRANVETQKLPYLKQVSVELDMLRVLTRLAHELRFMSTKQYEFVSKKVTEIGRLLGGWIKSSSPILPFIYAAMRSEGAGAMFISQQRIGRFNKPVTVYKLRTMTENRSASATWTDEDASEGNAVTPVGNILRKLSLDELPQVWSILKGDMSLIGPRNDIKGLGERLAADIPYYNVRNFVPPGVTGWAQTHQHYMANNISPQSIAESKERLSYDLYYVKNRSLMLDVAIALRTLKTVVGRFTFTIK